MKLVKAFLLSLCVCVVPAAFAQSESYVIDFAHHLLDTLSHMSDIEGLNYLSRNHITLELNDGRILDPSNLMTKVNEITTYSIRREEGVYQMKMASQNGAQLQMFFPADRELIQGTDKATADSLISLQIQSNANCESKPHERIYIPKAMNNGLYLHRGNWFLSPKIRNDVYLSPKGGELFPVFDKTYPEESFQNMLQGVTQNQVNLSVHHHQYSNRVVVIETPLNCLLDVLRENAKFYVACEGRKNGITGYAFIYNESLNCMHLLTVALSDDCFAGKTTLTAHLYTNIPQQNFKDYKLNNN